jgi:kinetochore protein NDC80
MTLDAQIERMEKELSKLRSGLTESVQMMEQREINTNLEYVLSNHLHNLHNAIIHTDQPTQ